MVVSRKHAGSKVSRFLGLNFDPAMAGVDSRLAPALSWSFMEPT